MKDKAINILLQEFQKNQYFKAIYLWGSITTDEFDSKTSDIDAIGIVEEDTSIQEKDTVNQSISAKLSQLKINFLYPSELNGGPTRDTIASFIPVECILYDMNFWIHVAGTFFKREDFVLGRRSIDEVIAASLSSIKERFLLKIKKEDYVYFIKAVAKLCYFIHQKEQNPKPFRYHDLVSDSSNETRTICESIFLIKESGWDAKLIESELLIFKEFVGRL